MFAQLYDRVMRYSAHPQASKYLCGLSFAESSFFPIPPDVMLAPMVVSRPNKAFWFAFLTTLFSVLGGIAGYFIGYFAFEMVEPWLQTTKYWPKYLEAREGFETWGVWLVIVAGFSPIPYKLFTITAGVLGQPIIPFILASFVGRGGRFFLVAGLLKWMGPKIEPTLKKNIEWLGWISVVLLVVGFVWIKYFH